MKQTKIAYKEIIVVVLMLFFLPQIMAFAVSSQYYDKNPLYMQPGETTETFFTLQNHAGDKDVTLRAKITDGKDILALTDASEIYTVPLGEKVKVNFKITAPANAKVGNTFPVTILFTTVTSSDGPIQLGSSIGKGFDVIIGPPPVKEVPAKKNNYWIYVLIAIIAAVIIIFFIIKKNIKEEKNFVRKKK